MKKNAIYYEILNYTPDNLALLHENFEVTTLHDPSQLNSEVLHECHVLFAPLGYKCDRDVMEHAPKLQVIATNTTGVPHIDTDEAKRHGIEVISLRDEADFLNAITPTAELTIGLLIAITRNMLPALDFTRQGCWGRWDFGGPAMLSRMALGIVGLGRLGKMVAKYAHALGMKVSYYNPRIAHDPAWPYTRVRTLEELVGHNDVVSVHATMTEANRHMFNAAVFARFKRGAFFVNTARGELVDSNALVEALDHGTVAGAALDVLDGEFEPGFEQRAHEHPLIRYAQRHKNLIITPHIAGSTKDAWALTQRFVIEKAVSCSSEKPKARRKRA